MCGAIGKCARFLVTGYNEAVLFAHGPSSDEETLVSESAATFGICLLPGDGIGPEIMKEAVKVLDAIGRLHNVSFSYEEALLGGIAIDETGEPLPPETLEAANRSDAVLLAAVGGPKWDNTDPDGKRPEQGLLGIRQGLGLFANLRPVHIFPALIDASPLKPELVRNADLVMVRELTGGLYFGARGREENVQGAGGGSDPGLAAFDALDYFEFEIERILRVAFNLAQTRGHKVTSVDKANILETSRLWREIAHRVAAEYPDVELSDMLVDNCAMQLVREPSQFDVIVTENMFGDILSDEAAMISGSLGLMASASLGNRVALYEPAHGSAPDIAGKGIANPLAMILSVALMLQYSLGMPGASADIIRAISAVLDDGWRTADMKEADTSADRILGTEAMGDAVVAKLTGRA